MKQEITFTAKQVGKYHHKKETLSIYIHIPFCLSKCSYCDFISFANINSLHKPYIDALLKEISLYKSVINNNQIATVFIGGGTPTSLSDDLFLRLIKGIDEVLALNCNSKNIEYTVEANPKTITAQKASTMKDYNINRVSLGLQSANETELKILNRIHNFKDLEDSVNILKNNGIDNVNIDLMYAIPNQTLKSFKTTLHKVLALNPAHISCYSLILEEGTLIYELYNKNKISFPTENEDISMYELAVNKLTSSGYEHYEISNFSLPDKKCSHNITYWKVMPYLGFGVSAHSFYDKYRYSNTNSIDEYIDLLSKNSLPIKNKELIDDTMAFEEWIFLRLRMKEGIKFEDINLRFNIDFLDKYKSKLDKLSSEGLVIYDEKKISLTLKGFELSNYVFLEILNT